MTGSAYTLALDVTLFIVMLVTYEALYLGQVSREIDRLSHLSASCSAVDCSVHSISKEGRDGHSLPSCRSQ